MGNRTFKDIVAEHGHSFRDAAEAYRHLTGETLSTEEVLDGLWYETMRRRMVALRKDRGYGQAEVGRRMGTSQGEVSRLENSLGPGTRLATVRGYLAAVDSSLEALLAPTGGVPFGQRPAAPWRAGAGTVLTIQGQDFTGAEAEGVQESLHAMNNVMLRAGMGRDARRRFIVEFLEELVRARSTVAGLAAPGIRVRVDLALGSGTSGAARARGSLGEAEFLEAVAAPLHLEGF